MGITALLLVAIGLGVLRLLLQAVISVIPARITTELQAHLRQDVFDGFSSAAWSEQSRDREGHLQEYLTNQITYATNGAVQATILIVAVTTLAVLILVALALNPVAAMVVLATTTALFFLLRPLSSLGSRYSRALSRASLSYAGGVNEAVRLAEETKVFGVSKAQRQRMRRLVAGLYLPVQRTQLLARLVPGIYQSLIYLLLAGALAIVHAAQTGHIAALGAVVLLLVRAGSYGQQAQGGYQGVRQALPYLERVEQAQARYRASIPAPGFRPLHGVHEIRFDRVSFAYEPGQPVLSNLSFGVVGREAVGIVGPTGAGKSTLVQILLGLREPSSGRYLVNDTLASEFRREDWEKVIAYLPQEPRLLHASVAENIRFLRDLSPDAVESAARLAGIHEEVIRWPHGYETIVGPRADAVSGGQQQRICLARALATHPQVLVLDEPTSALDPQTEVLIQESLAALKRELTLFIVAHRMSTLSICDRVMVIVDGQLQAFDTSHALVESSAYFRSASNLSMGTASRSALP
jgi:ATP-binding cassette subfamily B protein